MTPEIQALVTKLEFVAQQLEVSGYLALPCRTCRSNGLVSVDDLHAMLEEAVAALVQQAQEKDQEFTRVDGQTVMPQERATAAKNDPRAPEWRTCSLHPDVDPDCMWGCPDCLHELRSQLARMTAERDELAAHYNAACKAAEGEPVSDFEATFPGTQLTRDLRRACEWNEAQLAKAEAALSAHQEALEQFAEKWLKRAELGGFDPEEAPDATAYWQGVRSVARELKDRLAALASPRQVEQEHDEDDQTRVVESSPPDRAALPHRPAS